MSPWQPLLGLIPVYYFGTLSLNQVAATATLLNVKHTISSSVHFNHYKRQIFSLDIREYMLCRWRWSGPLKSHILIVGLGKQSVDRQVMRAHVAIKCKQAPVPPTKFSSYFKFWSKPAYCLYYLFYKPDRYEILHIPRQLCCLGMCKISLWSDRFSLNDNNNNFDKIWNFYKKYGQWDGLSANLLLRYSVLLSHSIQLMRTRDRTWMQLWEDVMFMTSLFCDIFCNMIQLSRCWCWNILG